MFAVRARASADASFRLDRACQTRSVRSICCVTTDLPHARTSRLCRNHPKRVPILERESRVGPMLLDAAFIRKFVQCHWRELSCRRRMGACEWEKEKLRHACPELSACGAPEKTCVFIKSFCSSSLHTNPIADVVRSIRVKASKTPRVASQFTAQTEHKRCRLNSREHWRRSATHPT